MTKIYTLVNVLGEWMVEPKPPTFTNESLANPLASFVIDPFSGNELFASSESLQAAMKLQGSPETKEKNQPPHCIWYAASRKSIRAAVNFNGERVAKVEFEDEVLSEVFYVTRHGMCAIEAMLMSRTKSASGDYDDGHGIVLLDAFPRVCYPS
jgi:syntaxin-binding protein 5